MLSSCDVIIIYKLSVQKAEAFSAKAVIEGFHSDEVFTKLDELMAELFAHRTDRLPTVPYACCSFYPLRN